MSVERENVYRTEYTLTELSVSGMDHLLYKLGGYRENRKKHMILKRKFALTLLSTAVVFSMLLLVANSATLFASSDSDDTGSATIRIAGADSFKVNHFVKSTHHFSPGTVHVKAGSTISLTNTGVDPHSFTLVDASLLPNTFDQIITCGPPGTICFGPLMAHFPQGPPPPTTTTCNPPTCVQFIDGGSTSATPPGLDTAWTMTTPGDSVIIAPGQTIQLPVTAAAGTTLHYFCIFHPWMQGEIIVDK